MKKILEEALEKNGALRTDTRGAPSRKAQGYECCEQPAASRGKEKSHHSVAWQGVGDSALHGTHARTRFIEASLKRNGGGACGGPRKGTLRPATRTRLSIGAEKWTSPRINQDLL